MSPLLAFWFIWGTGHVHIEAEQYLYVIQYRLRFCFPLLGTGLVTPWQSITYAELQLRERDE